MASAQRFDRQVAGADSRQSASTIGVMAVNRLTGLLLLGLAIYLTDQLDFARPYVAVILAACFVLQYCVPSAWLVYLPALLPIADLSLWSGRLYLSEFDLLVLVTAAAHSLRAPPFFGFPNFRRLDGWAIVLFLLLCLTVGAIEGAIPLRAPQATEIGDYLSHYNALRVAKSPLEAVLLLGALQWSFAASPKRTKALLILGVSLGLGLTGLIVFWERGVFLAIAQSSGIYAGRYAIADALLDFTSSYRATALFPEMNTGGGAIDTYLCLALPVALAGAFTQRQPISRLTCLACYVLGSYAAVATFSRGLYGGYAMGSLAVLIFIAIGHRRKAGYRRLTVLRIGAAGFSCLSALAIAYSHGGWNALFFGLVLGAACLGTVLCLRDRWQKAGLLVLIVLGCLGTLAFLHAFNSSRYVRTEIILAQLLAIACALLIAAAGALVSGRAIPLSARVSAGMAYVLFAAIAAIALPAIGGYRMVERLSTASNDATTRSGHWREALGLMGPGWQDDAFGMGLGSFPRLYFRGGQETETNASYRYRQDGGETWLQLGAGDFNLTQKIALDPDQHYEMSVAIRGDVPKAGVEINICPKLILIGDRWTPNCHEFSFAIVSPGQWEKHTVPFDSGSLGRDAPLTWPTTLMLHNSSDTALIEITAIHVTQDGREILSNGDFAAGGDRWIMTSDFEHLGWHIENLYVELFFEIGAIGLAAFVLTVALALVTAFKLARRRDPIGVAIGGALISFLTVGSVASLFDSPRPATLFFLFLFCVLLPSDGQDIQRLSTRSVA